MVTTKARGVAPGPSAVKSSTPLPGGAGRIAPAIFSVKVRPGRGGGSGGSTGAPPASSVQPCSFRIRAAVRSASAAMVRDGGTPSERGTTEASTTYRPGCTAVPVAPANTRPAESTTPSAAVSAIPQPPRANRTGTSVPGTAVVPSDSAARSINAFTAGKGAAPSAHTTSAVPSASTTRPVDVSCPVATSVWVRAAAPWWGPNTIAMPWSAARWIQRPSVPPPSAAPPGVPPVSPANPTAAPIRRPTAPGIAPSNSITPPAMPVPGRASAMPVVAGPTGRPVTGGLGLQPTPSMIRSPSQAKATADPLADTRWPRRFETVRPLAFDRKRIPGDPGVPAASTTTPARTNDGGASKRLRSSA
jgi:hypothetical protein